MMENFYLPVIDKDDEYQGLDGITVIAWSLFEQCSSYNVCWKSQSMTPMMLNCVSSEGATKIAYVMQCSLDLELPAICMVEISMMSNCVRQHV